MNTRDSAFVMINNYQTGAGVEVKLAQLFCKYKQQICFILIARQGGVAITKFLPPNGYMWPKLRRAIDSSYIWFLENGYEPKYRGMFWAQGESSCNKIAVDNYENHFNGFSNYVRARNSEIANMPIFLCKIHTDNVSSCDSLVGFNSTIDTICKNPLNFSINPNTEGATLQGDNVHWDYNGMIIMAEAWYREMKNNGYFE
jgi:hypothetical protein